MSSNGKFFYYWGPLLLHDKVSEEFLQELEKDGASRDLIAHDHSDHLAGKIEVELNYSYEQRHKYSQYLSPYIDSYISTLLTDWKPNRQLPIKSIEANLESIWINYQKKGEYNPLHTHDSNISFVIYLDIPEEILKEEKPKQGIQPGSILFRESLEAPVSANATVADKLLANIKSVNIIPQRGDILMFPASLHHEVSAFSSDVCRISVAGNFDLKIEVEDNG